jgi:hypothetical protein
MLKMNAYKWWQSFMHIEHYYYSHYYPATSIDPHMAGTPANEETANENKTSHIDHTDTIDYTSIINYIITILNSSPLHQFLIVSYNKNNLIKIGV